MRVTSENPSSFLPVVQLSLSHLPSFPLGLSRIVTTALLLVAGTFAPPAEATSSLGWPLLAQRAVDGLDDEREIGGSDWEGHSPEPALLHGGGAGHIVDGVIPGGRPGLPLVKDPLPAVPMVLPAVPAALPRRSGIEPHGEGGARVVTTPNVGARELRLQMREYGARHGDPQGEGKSSSHLLHEATGEVRWLDAEERTIFREALRERHHRARH